jgi:hypothetical protein
MHRSKPRAYQVITLLALSAGAIAIALPACSSTSAPKTTSRPTATTNEACPVEGATIETKTCPDKRTTCYVKCVDKQATVCGPCPEVVEGEGEGPGDGGPPGADTGPGTGVNTNNVCVDTGTSQTKIYKLSLAGGETPIRYNFQKNYTNANSASKQCLPNGAPGPDGVTGFLIEDDARFVVTVGSAALGSGDLTFSVRTACAPESEIPDSCFSFRPKPNEGVSYPVVNKGDKFYFFWDFSDPAATSLELSFKLLPREN